MAPEQVLGKGVDPQSDLYSVGATAFTLLSKRYVHDAENAGEMMVVVGSRPARSLALVSPELPAPLTAVIDRALRFEKSERWPDARTMRAALADAYRQAFDAPMPGAEDAEAEEESESPESNARPASGSGRMSDRASSAVTVLTGATPVVTGIVEPLRGRFPTQDVRRWRPRVLAGGVLLTLAVGGVVAMTAGGPSVSPTDSVQSGRAPAAALRAPASDPSPAWFAPSDSHSTVADPTSVPVESLPAAGQAPPTTVSPVPAVGAAPSPPRAVPARQSCVPPFVVDPATGKKKWKLECL
jgi:serine/threonine-protein kinase